MGSPYQPLPIPSLTSQPMINQAFTAPQLSFEDILKSQAMQRAQDLANQTNELNLQQKQQEEADKKAIEDAIKAQYAGMDPNAEVNPKDALDTALRLSLQQGNLDQALKIGQQKLLTGNLGDRPLTLDEVQFATQNGFPVDEGTKLSELKAMATARNSATTDRKVGDIQKRAEWMHGWLKSKAAAPGIFDPDTNPDGTPKILTPDQQKNLQTIEPQLTTVIRNGNELVSMLKDDRFPIGDKMVMQEQALTNMMPALRALDNQGVRFNEFIRNQDIQQMGSDQELAHRIMGAMTGQDPALAMERFVREITQQSLVKAHANNGRISIDKLSMFDPSAPSLFDKYGAFSVGQNRNPLDVANQLAGPNLAPVPLAKYGAGGPPLQPNGQPLSREQFMQYLASQKGG